MQITNIHICYSRFTAKFRKKRYCPDCKQTAWMLEFYEPWYGTRYTCLNCGREYQDGEWMTLGFYRGSRQKNIDAAQKLWRELPPVSKNHWGLD